MLYRPTKEPPTQPLHSYSRSSVTSDDVDPEHIKKGSISRAGSALGRLKK